MNEAGAPELPGYALYPLTIVIVLIIGYQAFAYRRSPAAQFVLLAVALRYFLSAFHEFTFTPVFAGLSINALSSVLVTGLGLLVIDWRDLGVGKLWPFYFVIATIIVSALTSGYIPQMIGVLAKWGYLIVVMLATLRALRSLGERAFFGLVLWAFVAPIAMQWASVVLGVAKQSESDGSASFIGGYNHEAAFSVVLVTALGTAFLGASTNVWARLAIIVLGLVGLLLANYRTTMIAAAPLVAGFLTLELTRLATPRERPLYGIFGFVLLTIGSVVAVAMFAERFSDLNMVFHHGAAIFKPPEDFTNADRDLLSGRLYLWSSYIDSYRAGSDTQLLFGQGPDSWADMFGLYAHNTLVSFLYECGLFGALAMVTLWATMIGRVAVHAPDNRRWRLICAHAAFVIINQATMGHWLIEGQVFYALICGHSFYCTEWRRRAPAGAHGYEQAPLYPELARLQRSARAWREKDI